MSEDLIKKADAIRAIDEWIQCGTDRDDDIVISEFLSFLKGDINAIPSADIPSAVDLSSVYSTAYKSRR